MKTKKEQLLHLFNQLTEEQKQNTALCLFIRMPTGETEYIENPAAGTKVEYIDKKYNDDLVMYGMPEIYITSFFFIPLHSSFDFGRAIKALLSGKRVARKGWNGRGIFIELQVPDEYSKMTHPYIYMDMTGLQTTNPDAPKDRVPWLASQTDMLATDWMIV